ncbi:MAG: 6-bladed beta-propeller [Vicinamibacterales bacterium]
MSRARLLSGLAAALVAGGVMVGAQGAVPEIAFDSNADLLRTPLDVFVGEVGGVAANSKGQIYVYTRTGHPYATLGDNRTFYRGGAKLFQFDASGKFVRELGQDVYGFNGAYGLRIDPQDNIWTIDVGANQVVKFDAEGRVAMVLGRKPETMLVRPREGGGPGGGGGGGGGGAAAANRRPGEGVPGTGFSKPTDVAWDSAGNVYVTDGIGANNRVVKTDKFGHFLTQWGATGSGQGEFNGAKAIAVDKAGDVYVLDTGNKRVQIFDPQGTYKREFAFAGTALTMCMTRGATQYLYISHAGDTDGMEDAAIFKVGLDGKVLGKFGSAGKRPKEFGLANSIDCRNENELLVGELTNWRVQKVTLKGGGATR